nr:MAG TPA: Tne2, Tni2 VI secretion, effector, immunity [Caudoviricetes sp.]
MQLHKATSWSPCRVIVCNLTTKGLGYWRVSL